MALFAGPRGTRRKFYVMSGLLVCAVGLVAVPIVAEVFDAMTSFDPRGYDPKDFARTRWINYRGVTAIFTGAEAYLAIAFLLLCALFFMNSRRN